jgi:hypothetical protein
MLLASYAVVTLAHEVQHRNGVFDEAAAECLGIQHAPDTARALGLDKAYTEELLAVYWAEYDDLEEVYRSQECKRGGELDARVSTAIWP